MEGILLILLFYIIILSRKKDIYEYFYPNEIQYSVCQSENGKGETDIGVIAQEVEQVLPYLVSQREDGKLAVKYQSLIPLLIDAVKSLKQDVEELKGEIDGRTKGQ